MKFRDLLKEKFYKGFDIDGDYVEVYVNPNQSDVKNVLKTNKYKALRIGTNKRNLYIWDADFTHDDMMNKMNIGFDHMLSWTNSKPNRIDVSGDSDGDLNDSKLKKKLKSIFPKAKYIDAFDVKDRIQL